MSNDFDMEEFKRELKRYEEWNRKVNNLMLACAIVAILMVAVSMFGGKCPGNNVVAQQVSSTQK